tara:strand:- start:336 stop:551 length:216 start_codon:yes stop_codon:yes gene_type:complete
MSQSFDPTQSDELISSLKRIAKALENLPYELNKENISIYNSSLEDMNTKMEDLGYLHGIAKQIDELKKSKK